MSSKDNPCRKFQANIFNKSKCQNCFKPRESHLLSDEDLNQAKPIYGGWLLLAPEGTNFGNPLHRSRKWQRRFFILYEHGLLRYALDEMPSTLPQGTINMNQCSDVIDGESRTGQKNSLCVLTPDREHFIRAECREIINGWQEALTVYPRTNKQNQKKKRKVEPPTPQEPGPAKVTVTSSGGSIPCLPSSIASAERVPASRSTLWQEERWSRASTIPCSRSASCLSQLTQSHPGSSVTREDGSSLSGGRKVRVESGYFSLEKTKSPEPPQPPQHQPLTTSTSLGVLHHRRSQVIGKFESGDGEGVEHMDTTSPSEPSSNTVSVQRQGRSERRSLACKQEMSLDAEKERCVPDVSCSFNFRRAKSLDRRVTESSMTPDLLNFKKGWMTKLYEDGMWKKHWFVLTDQSLRYYRDSIAEEAADMDGEIDLSTCYDVTEFPVQRNYGFQILSKEGACTLSAMTSGIRRNWIQAIMKNVRPTIAPPDVTRKNISLKLSVLKPSSLPEEKTRGRVVLHPSPQPGPDPSPESPRVEVRVVKTQRSVDHAPATVAAPASEPRKSRVRERRREGRSKTYDWSEFQPGQTEDPKRDKAPDTVDLSSASSSSTSSSSSSTSSLASSPISTTSSPPTSSSISAPPPGQGSAVAAREEAEQERGRRRDERQQRFKQNTHAPSTVTTTMTSTVNAVGAEPRNPGESQDQGRMEVDHPEPGAAGSGESDGRAPDVQVEIEQRWHQVETTPLREEKQVPISTTDACLTERLPPQELAALLDKELGQTQKELARLQEQNNLLQEQLEDARGREHSAREGYVLQSGTSPPSSSSPHRAPWQRLHKLNQDLQNDLEAQRRKQDLAQHQVQTLRRSYTEAQDAIGRHEADIQALQAKLSSAMAEILASEQAVARMRNELKLEQERSREQEEEWVRSDATLRVQLRDSEDRLREVEASLLERSQALRHLERQQALQRDHLREVHRLQERLAEVTGRLSATEQGQALKEERLRTEQRSLQESHERERQSLARRLAEAESGRAELEERLLEAEQQVEALLRGMRASDGDEVREEVMRLQEDLAQTTDVAETLRESVRRLEEEKGRLTCRCQELLNQISEADREVTKLRSRLETEEADYYTLEHSYERASEEFQKISRVLQEKEEEIRQTKEMYERLVERKEEDLNEALIKMAALGSSLEETEQRLQAREALLCQMGEGLRGQSEACSAETDLQAKLVVAEDRIAELEQHLNALQLGYADLRMERQRAQEGALHARETTKERGQSFSNSLPTNTDSSLTFDLGSKAKSSSDGDESQAKRQRIRFSSIQCQKYIQSEDLENSNADNTSSDISEEISQDFQPSMETNSSDITFQYCSDPEKFISIITALEIKLLATEEKLRDLTQKLEEQRVDQPEGLMEGQGSWTGTDSELQELNARLQQEEAPSSALPGPVSQITAAKHQYAKALVCVESSREKVRGILSSHCQGSTGLQLHTLSEIENELVSATLYIREGGMTWNEHPSEVTQSQAQEIHKSKASDEETIRLFAKTLSFEAMVLNKMAFLIQNPDSDLVQRLIEICRETESIKRSDGDCVAIVYADVLTRKLMLESAFWAEVEKMESHCELMQGESSDVKSTVASMSLEANVTVIYNTCVKAELSHSLQSLKSFYEEKFKMLKRELAQAHGSLQQRESALKEIIQAPKRLDLRKVLQDVSNEFGFSEEQSLADLSELAPYMEQIEMEEAQDLAEEVVDRHLEGDVPSCSVDSVESLQVGRDNLAAELERQAAILHRFSQAIESGSHPGLANIIQATSSYQSTLNLTGGSLCMREALIQAQVAYVACRLRADHERDLVRYRQAGHSMDVLVQEHACTVGAIRDRYEASLQEERQGFTCTMASLQDENQALRGEMGQRVEKLSQQQERLALLEERFHRETEELRQRHQLELSQAEQGRASTELALMETTADSQRKLEVLLVDMDTIDERHEGHLRRLEEQFQGQIRELQQVHQEEIQRLHAHYTETIRSIQDQEDSGSKGDSSPESGHSQSPLPEEVTPSTEQAWPMEEEEQGKGEEGQARVATDPMVVLKDRIQELETQMDTMRDELETKHLEGDVASLREKYQRDFESLKATCERGFTAMEETHHKVVEDLQRQHQREVSKLLEERERLLAEETAATIAAIEAMKNAHREEMEKNQRSQISGLSTDIDELHEQYQEELQSIQRELEVLSEQYSQKCLENAHLAQALEAERQALRQCQRENQELNAHNQELNNRLTVEITRMRSCYSGETSLSPFTQGKDLYELEVLLRIKESEIQYLKQEIHSLKDELQSALRDKKYATDKYKDIYTELSIVKAKADCDITKLTEKLLVATEALGERNVDGSATPGYDIMKSKSNPDFLKKERSTLSKQIRGVRSKSLKEGLTVQERMKLFEAKDSRKI
ncbi:myosin phosphatase Rho-interacting protein isoform X4 [Salmo salar]|uniref:Myosin phosphatase Rho-interacting protein isoform X4 n=1 Tax=Salmo salar TaxID=8030 RepID=A0ABM3DI80_SALSA|nr:putative leucine-rich repeat-containing protein DDB_G0290503 isoform X4 [Salmo salar]